MMRDIMRQYELMLVVRPDFPAGDTKKVEELVKKSAGVDGAVLKKVSVLGKKTLAYPIKKLNEGIYLLADLEAPSLIVSQVEKQTKLGTDVIRFLLRLKEG